MHALVLWASIRQRCCNVRHWPILVLLFCVCCVVPCLARRKFGFVHSCYVARKVPQFMLICVRGNQITVVELVAEKRIELIRCALRSSNFKWNFNFNFPSFRSRIDDVALTVKKYVGPVPTHYAAVRLKLRSSNLNFIRDPWPFELNWHTGYCCFVQRWHQFWSSAPVFWS